MSDFPYNIVDELAVSLETLNSGVATVVKRPVSPDDPDTCIGVFAMDWSPDEMGIGQFDPTFAKYNIVIQALVKHLDEEEGRREHALLTKSIRTMVYRDTDLRLRFGQLSEASGGVIERLQRWGISRQRFLSNEIQSEFLFLSSTELWVQVEQVA